MICFEWLGLQGKFKQIVAMIFEYSNVKICVVDTESILLLKIPALSRDKCEEPNVQYKE